MSFRFSFLVNSLVDATRLIEAIEAPQQIKEFVLLAVQVIVSSRKPFLAIRISAEGHLGDSMSTATISVHPVLDNYWNPEEG